MAKRKTNNKQKKEVNYILEDENMVGSMEKYKTRKEEVWGWR